MNKYLVRGKIITPIHIGSGDTLDPLSYFMADGKMFVIDQYRFISSLPEKKKNEFIDYIDRDRMSELRSFIRTNAERDADYILYSAGVSDDVAKEYQDKIGDRNLRNQLLIHSYIREPYSPSAYIPGSSIKGAIRTALLNFLLHDADIPMLNKVEHFRDEKYPPKRARLLEAEILNNVTEYRKFDIVEFKPNIQRDPFRMFKVFDMPLPLTAMEVRKVFNVSGRSDGHSSPSGIPMVYELAKSKTDFEGTIELLLDEREKLNEIAMKRDQINQEIDLALIRDACITYYGNNFIEEKDHFEHLSPTYYNALYQVFDGLQDNEILIRMGKFSQVEFMTLNQFRDPKTPRNVPYRNYGRTRNLADGKIPMGWVKLGFYHAQ